MHTSVDAVLRDDSGKKAAKRVRNENRIPAVIYGHEFASMPISLDSHDFMALLRRESGMHGLIDLKIEGKKGGKHTVVVKEIQRHPIKDIVLHVDFQRVKETEKIQTEVPIYYHGEPEGILTGGLLQHYIYGAKVETLPKDLPERIDLDISGLKLGQSLKVSDLPEHPGVTYLNGPDEIMVSVMARRVKVLLSEEEEEAEEAAAAAAAAEKAEEPEASE
jgi:large subunit ribosomal protein L25